MDLMDLSGCCWSAGSASSCSSSSVSGTMVDGRAAAISSPSVRGALVGVSSGATVGELKSHSKVAGNGVPHVAELAVIGRSSSIGRLNRNKWIPSVGSSLKVKATPTNHLIL